MPFAYIVGVKKAIIYLIIIHLSICMQAQTIQSVAREYYLRGVMEVGSGFKLNPDSTFQFFFSYGALDRSGEGRWTIANNQVILNSRELPGKDFVLTERKKTTKEGITIRITDPNKQLLNYVYCVLSSGASKVEQMSNKDGLIHFPLSKADTIMLTFEFCSERSSTFVISDPTHNDFSFRFETWLTEVFFKELKLNITAEGLEGQHPLLKSGTYRFVK